MSSWSIHMRAGVLPPGMSSSQNVDSASPVQVPDGSDIAWRHGSFQAGGVYRVKLNSGSTLVVPLGDGGEITSASKEMCNSSGDDILFGDASPFSRHYSMQIGKTERLPGMQIRCVDCCEVEIIASQARRYMTDGDVEISAIACAGVPKIRSEKVVLEAGHVYLLQGRDGFEMSIDLDSSFSEGEQTLLSSHGNPHFNESVSSTNSRYRFYDDNSVMVKPNVDLRCRLFEVDVQRLPNVRMRDWTSPPTAHFYPIEIGMPGDVRLRMSRAALRRRSLSLLRDVRRSYCLGGRGLTGGDVMFVINDPEAGRTRLWPLWAPLPEGYRRDYRITAIGDWHYLTCPWESASSSAGVCLENYREVVKFNRAEVAKGVVCEAYSKGSVRLSPEWHPRSHYCGMTTGNAKKDPEPMPYDLLQRIMERMGIQVVEDEGEAINDQFKSTNLSPAQTKLVVGERDNFLRGAGELIFKFHVEVPDDKRLAFLHAFAQELFNNRKLASRTDSFKMLHAERDGNAASVTAPLFVIYPAKGVREFIESARLLRDFVGRIDIPASGAVPRFSIPIEPTGRLFMVLGGGMLKLGLRQQGLLDAFFDSAYNYALPHVVTRDPSGSLMRFLNG